jgi:FkbM family methyltransferase
MKQFYNYWLPDDESHFSKFIERNAKAGEPAEYQGPVRRLALGHVTKFNVSVDIGANFGLWSHTLEQKFLQNFAVEPVQLHCDYLVLNAPSTKILQTALGNTTGTVMMQRFPDNYGKTRVSQDGDIQVPLRRLDDLELPPADFVKIDVEGFELQVLQGGENYIKRSYPVMVVEQESRAEAHTLLLSWGYQLVNSIKHDYIYKHEFN